jgi:hypothetical protein
MFADLSAREFSGLYIRYRLLQTGRTFGNRAPQHCVRAKPEIAQEPVLSAIQAIE